MQLGCDWQSTYAEEEAVQEAYLAADSVGRKSSRGRWEGVTADIKV